MAEFNELQKDESTAIANYVKAVEFGERAPAVLSRAVLLLHQHHQYAKADELIGQMKRQGSAFSNDLIKLATANSLQVGDTQSAFEYTKEFSKRSKQVGDHLWTGLVLSNLGKRDEAEQSFRNAIALDETAADPRVALILHFGQSLKALKADLGAARSTPQRRGRPRDHRRYRTDRAQDPGRPGRSVAENRPRARRDGPRTLLRSHWRVR